MTTPSSGQPLTPAAGANTTTPPPPQATTQASVGGWWNSFWGGVVGTGVGLGPIGGGVFNWSDLAAGIESAFVAFLRDLWDGLHE